MTVDDSTAARPRSPIPMARRIVGVFLLLMLIALLGAEFLSHSFPTPLGRDVALALAAPFGLYLGWLVYGGGFNFADPRIQAERRAGFIASQSWLRVPIVGLAVFGLVFVGMEDGVFAVVTAAIGQPAARTVTITGKGGGGRTCSQFYVQEAPFLFSRALCATRQELAQGAPGRKLILVGKGSDLGLNVEAFQFGPQPAAISQMRP